MRRRETGRADGENLEARVGDEGRGGPGSKDRGEGDGEYLEARVDDGGACLAGEGQRAQPRRVLQVVDQQHGHVLRVEGQPVAQRVAQAQHVAQPRHPLLQLPAQHLGGARAACRSLRRTCGLSVVHAPHVALPAPQLPSSTRTRGAALPCGARSARRSDPPIPAPAAPCSDRALPAPAAPAPSSKPGRCLTLEASAAPWWSNLWSSARGQEILPRTWWSNLWWSKRWCH